MGRGRLSTLAAALLAAAVSSAHAENPVERGRLLVRPDCADPADMVVQYDAAPVDRTYLRVQHMGDPGTDELRGQVANVVTWNVAEMTGLEVAAGRGAQRGWRNDPPPVASSAFQLGCEGGGFFINTWQFSHAAPLVGEGPNASIARDLAQPLPLFRDGASIVIEGNVRVPWIRNQRKPVTEGTAQVGFFHYVRDKTTGTVIAQLVTLFEDRAPGVGGSGVESIGSDGIVAFISSPLAALDGRGDAVRFVTATADGAHIQYEKPWAEMRRFEARITPGNFAAALAALRAGPLANISGEPSDYEMLSFGFGGEVIPGTGNDDNLSLGASVTGLALRELPLLRRPR